MKKNHKWTLAEQSRFLKMVGELLSRGYPLPEALTSIQYHLPKEQKKEIQKSLELLKGGDRFYQILKRLNFNDYLIGYVFFAEHHGDLATAFQEGSKMMERQAGDIARLKKLLSYPLFLILSTLILMIFVDHVLLPRFTSLFSSMNVETNLFTHVIHILGKIIPFLFIFIPSSIVMCLLYYVVYFQKLSGIEQKRRLMKIPILSSFLRLFYSHYFSTQLSYLLAGGLSVNEALTMFEKNEGQRMVQEIGKEMKKQLLNGETLESIVVQYSFFERELTSIIKHGQENGKLDQELVFFATQCLQLLEEKTDKLIKRLQPILFLFIGGFVITMYLAVMLPMFHLMDGI